MNELSDNEPLVERLAKAGYDAVANNPLCLFDRSMSRDKILAAVRAQLVADGVVRLVPREKTTGERIAEEYEILLYGETGLLDSRYRDFIKSKTDSAIAEMKERCAKVVEAGGYVIHSVPYLAAAIRALK